MFIEYVDKPRSNLQPHVLINLFKAYCCSFYGLQLWKFNSVGIDKCCKSWNIAVYTLLGLPYNVHTYLLGPIMGQLDLCGQLYICNFRFLWHNGMRLGFSENSEKNYIAIDSNHIQQRRF